MGSLVLKGITTALLVTILTLFAGLVWSVMGLGGLNLSRLLDIGLLVSCLVGGYRTAKESGEWLLGGATGAGYVTVGTLLLALFLPIRGWGFIQVLAEGAIIGLVAGAFAAGGGSRAVSGAGLGRRSPTYFEPSYDGYGTGTRESVDSDHEFDWNTEENFQPARNEPISKLNWVEGSENELRGNRRARREVEEVPEVKWSWDNEEDQTLISDGSGHDGPLAVWEPEPVHFNGLERNRTSLSNVSEPLVGKSSRPFWEQ